MQLFSTPPRVAFRRPWPGTRRGLVLWLLCLVVIILGGVNYIGTELPQRGQDALAPMLDLMPSSAWGWMFIVVGTISGFLAYCHFDRDHVGYALMTGLTGFWGSAYLIGFAVDWVRDDEADWRIVGSAAIWLIFAALLIVCRGFAKTPLAIKSRRERRAG